MTSNPWHDLRNDLPVDLGLGPKTFGSSGFLDSKFVTQTRLNEKGEGKSSCPYVGAIPPKTIQEIGAYRKEPLIEIFARPPETRNYIASDQLQSGTGHIITFGTTRSGKGTGQIIPNLLQWNGSVLVLDIKGENYLKSAGYRAEDLQQNVIRFSPFERESHIWNPIKSIRTIEDWENSDWNERCQEEEDARYLANLIIVSSGSKNDQFWEVKAKSLLVGLLLHVSTAALAISTTTKESESHQHRVKQRSMREITRLITLEPDDFQSMLKDMSDSDRTLVRQVGTGFQGYLKREGKLGESIKAMLIRHLDVWSYERVHRVTYKPSANEDDNEPGINDFDFSRMRDGNTSFYLIIPPEYLSEYRSVLRVLIGSAIRELKNSYIQSKTNPSYSDKPPVLFLLDEFAQLANMSPIEEGLSYLAGYDVRLWLFLQDINQLKVNYPDSWESFLANTEFKCFFGVNDINTAKLVSEMTGTKTIPNLSNTKGSAVGDNTVTHGYIGRPLLTPDEVLHMHPNNQIVFIKSLYPLCLDLPKYYNCNKLKGRSELPPPQDISFI